MINVLGSGIAGLTSAIKLSREGEEVIIYEKNNLIGEHQNENTQAIRNYEDRDDQLLEFQKYGLKVNGFKPIYKIEKFAPSGKSTMIYSKKKPMFYVFKRGSNNNSLDFQLYKQAENLGVDIKLGKEGKINNCKIISNGPKFNDGYIYGIELKNVSVDSEKILFFMDNDYAPAGYIYATPYGKDSISIAITSTNKKIDLKKNLFNFISKNKVLREITKSSTNAHDFSGFAYFNIPETAIIKKKLFVGGAAGFIDPARGFGVKYAIGSGIHAANSIIEDKNYDVLWKMDFEKELIEGFMRRLMLEKSKNEDYEKTIEQEKINVKNYKKIPNEIDEIVESLQFELKLNEWRKKHDLNKILN